MISLNLTKSSEVKKAGDHPIIILKKLAFKFLLHIMYGGGLFVPN